MSSKDLSRFRDYLRFLAEVEMEPHLQRKLDPSDLVQETLLKAYESIDQLRGQSDGELAAWLRKILARNLSNALRDLQSQKRDIRRESSFEDAMENSCMRLGDFLQSRDPSPSKKMQTHEALMKVVQALSKLPDSQRQALLLKHWHEWSLADIGKEMGRTPAGVAGLLRRALRRLREELNDLK